MKPIQRLILTVSLLVASPMACNAPETAEQLQARIEQESSLARAEIEARGAEFVRLYGAKEVDRVAEMFTEDAYLMPPGVPAVIGRRAIREHIAQGLTLGSWQQSITTDQVEANGPLAVERGRFVISFTPEPSSPPGMTPFRQSGQYLIHWRRDNGDWRIANYVGSNDGSPVQE